VKIQLAAPVALSQIAADTCGTLHGSDRQIHFICTDSREADSATLFLALPGERVDGHDFLHAALEQGCRSALVSRPVEESLSFITVPSVPTALLMMGARMRDSFTGAVVAVTGSVGKTTVKNYIAAVLSCMGRTEKTVANHNSLLGLPMSLLAMTADAPFHVVEMGMNHAGEIDRMTRAAKPHVAVITNVGTAHIGNLGSRRGIADAKLEIIHGMTADDVLIINGDEPLLQNAGNFPGRVIRVSVKDPTADVYVTGAPLTLDTSTVSVTIFGKCCRNVRVPLLGEPALWAVGYAAAVGSVFGMEETALENGCAAVPSEKMRGGVVQKDGVVWLEDCYNASYESVAAALDVLHTFPGRHIAVLGDMLELGDESRRIHENVGKKAAQTCDLLLTYGPMSVWTAQAAVDAGMPAQSVLVYQTEAMDDLKKTLYDTIGRSDTVLVKGSRGMEMERLLPQ